MRFLYAGIAAQIAPFVAIMFCVIWSMWYNSETTTWTHCRVSNRLPTISAAIGSHQPQRFVWQFAISLSCLIRFYMAFAYFVELFPHLNQSNRNSWLMLHFLLNITELSSLLGLSFVTSTDNYDVHRNFFILFLLASLFYTTCHLYITYKMLHESVHWMTPISFKCKRIAYLALLLSIFLTVYCFDRHNRYCEAEMYSKFAFFEYLVVFFIILFHGTSIFDFRDKHTLFLCKVKSVYKHYKTIDPLPF